MPQHSTREAAASALLTTGPMYNGDWGRERPSVVWRVLHEGWGLPGEVRVHFPRCGGSCSMRSPWPVRSHPCAVVGCVRGGQPSMMGGRLMPLTQAVTTPSAAHRGNRTGACPPCPVPAAAQGCQSGGSRTASSSQNLLLPQTMVVVPQSSAGRRSPRWTGKSPAGPPRASVPESREKPVSKGTGRGDGLRYRLMRRLD